MTLKEKRGEFSNSISYNGSPFPSVGGRISIGTSNRGGPLAGVIFENGKVKLSKLSISHSHKNVVWIILLHEVVNWTEIPQLKPNFQSHCPIVSSPQFVGVER